MKVELTIDSMKEIPKSSVSVLAEVLLKRLENHYENCSLRVFRAGSDGLSIPGCEKEDKNKTEISLQETSESADNWFY